MIPDFTVFNFPRPEHIHKPQNSQGVASSSNNWITGKYGDHIELRGGSQLLGHTRQTRSCDPQSSLRWPFEAKTRFGLSVLDYM